MPTPTPELPPPPALDPALVALDPATAVRDLVARRDAWFRVAAEQGSDALAINRASSRCIDAAISALYERALGAEGGAGESAVLALGGYGREEMGPACDIDLLFLVDPGAGEHAAAITDAILYPFWDSGVEIGGATRTLVDCRAVTGRDVRALTAMLDGRRICGAQQLETGFEELLRSHFASREAKRCFVEAKIAERDERRARGGMELYALQPNVKEGAGGLREYQTFLWIARALHPEGDPLARLLPEPETRERLSEALRFLWGVRNALHLAEGCRADRLSESMQEGLAHRMGFAPEGESSAVTRFMAAYYRHAEFIARCSEAGIEAARRELAPPARLRRALLRRRAAPGIVLSERRTLTFAHDRLAGDEGHALRLFALACRHGRPVDPLAEAALAAHAWSAPEAAMTPATAFALRELFGVIPHLGDTLLAMHRAGMLARWFPEFAPIFHNVQHDGLHVSTVGIHSIAAVAELGALSRARRRRGGDATAGALAMVRRPAVLALALFLHDVGKGRGGDHAEKGGALALAIARRMGFAEQDSEDIAFLVRSHLLLSQLAFRRDVRDPAMLARFAQTLRSPELLAMLYLLTVADLRAVSPRMWSDWKAGLLAELFERTLEQMADASPAKLRREEERLLAGVRRRLGREGDPSSVRDFLAKLPERYRRAVPAEAIAAHLLMVRELPREPVATCVRSLPERGCTELSIVTRDAPGLFAKIAGVLTAGGANIVDAALSTTTDGVAIDVLWITDALHKPFDDPAAWRRIRAELREAIEGTRDLASIVGGRFKRRLLSQGGPQREATVAIDNDVSAQSTVVEISADDRRGLLYTIAATLHELGCTIDLARITTHVDRVTDVFYIQDADGRKPSSRERLEAIRARLIEALLE